MTDHNDAIESPAAQVTAHAGGRYHQQLSRSIGILGNVFITLSGVTPAASVFIIAPVALAEAGSGVVPSFVFAAIVGVFMALLLGGAFRGLPDRRRRLRAGLALVQGPAASLAGRPGELHHLRALRRLHRLHPGHDRARRRDLLRRRRDRQRAGHGCDLHAPRGRVAILKIRFNAVLTGIFLGSSWSPCWS